MESNDHFFETVYKNADINNLSTIPWATMKPNTHLQKFLEETNTPLKGCALVIGCGLGDDADALAKAGYQVDAIDISQTAITIAKERFSHENIDFCVENIFSLPECMRGKYDFVFESRTIQSINPKFKTQLIDIISNLLAPEGELLLHANIQDDEESYGGPPWPLYRRDIELFVSHDLQVMHQNEVKIDKPIAPYDIVVHYKKSRNKGSI